MSKPKHHDEHMMTDVQCAIKGMLEDVLGVAKILGLHDGEIAAVFGNVAGNWTACEDDGFAHDPEWIARMKAERQRKGRPETLSPLKDTLLVNFEYAYKKHIAKHDMIRAGRDKGTELLNKVCESHANQKGK